ncbi:hypothetical protein VNO77_03679 [Canavalia gladiata]|uniref:Uncharacterized protein n=1 Tax=Canavalia gladiata TaxID=3824 RepID=A0AAN9R8D0_CANGL
MQLVHSVQNSLFCNDQGPLRKGRMSSSVHALVQPLLTDPGPARIVGSSKIIDTKRWPWPGGRRVVAALGAGVQIPPCQYFF